ncbi:phosphate binding protein [Thermanaerovibrio acidaminovorans DSM 6589]|uniref:Phosphate-binding protein n=1 Tax=Thermanaerovibrio acidaminovorans (strain ATCC 49978 / DSM 6589 / Su883) TaxID=525903 RepID=D1B7T2_THEAS|nr:phosphate ABC transporter substrate-binding protein [Thermanaerovibrio acidaminovorans]ACZ18335.1 phosphate binding protein [Thermanaerovibrio acidaminovorans DSM 6589]
MRSILRVLCAALLVGVLGGAAMAGEIVMNGSTTLLPFAQSAAEAFMKANPGVKISVSGGGSGNGIKALIDGTTHIANSSREMKSEEIEKAKTKGVTPVKHVVAFDCIIPIVHPSNPVSNLTVDQLKNIYTGKVRNWKEVGGPDKPIVVLSRDTSSGTYEVWEQKVLRKEPVSPRALTVASSGAMIQTVAKNPLAIGYDGIGYVDQRFVKPLKINGVDGTPTTARNGKFPTARELYMYTNGEPKGEVKAFIDFMKGPNGQRYVAKEGFVTLKP